MKRAIMAVTLVCAITFAEPARARYQAELESTYLGDGWFQYRLRTINDPFFWFFDVTGLGIYHFSELVELGPATVQWQSRTFAGSSSNAPGITWDYLGAMTSQVRPYEAVFLGKPPVNRIWLRPRWAFGSKRPSRPPTRAHQRCRWARCPCLRCCPPGRRR